MASLLRADSALLAWFAVLAATVHGAADATSSIVSVRDLAAHYDASFIVHVAISKLLELRDGKIQASTGKPVNGLALQVPIQLSSGADRSNSLELQGGPPCSAPSSTSLSAPWTNRRNPIKPGCCLGSRSGSPGPHTPPHG
ncbi:unnamed protein product [Durusdinium trenchii]|uniref:Uncharacterized protein n=1 Tax=Durusdinium trenchii TaxID=1381693 RepID=A0ABP0R5C3_9DINO